MRKLLIFMSLIILVTGCASTDSSHSSASDSAQHGMSDGLQQEEAAEQTPLYGMKPEELALEIVHLLKDRDMLRLAAYVHPTKGLRVTPYGYINTAKDIVISAVELQTAMEDEEPKIWGSYDGSGEPIQLTFADYFDQFIYNRDYAEAEEIGYNRIIGQGNSINNVKDVYPNGYMVEFHDPGSEEFDGMDWSSLRIVLEVYEGQWVCTALIHDQWTI